MTGREWEAARDRRQAAADAIAWLLLAAIILTLAAGNALYYAGVIR
jgi:hypothetical protein